VWNGALSVLHPTDINLYFLLVSQNSLQNFKISRRPKIFPKPLYTKKQTRNTKRTRTFLKDVIYFQICKFKYVASLNGFNSIIIIIIIQLSCILSIWRSERCMLVFPRAHEMIKNQIFSTSTWIFLPVFKIWPTTQVNKIKAISSSNCIASNDRVTGDNELKRIC
jgi:hypothetical protein